MEEKKEITLTCTRCGKRNPVSNMKYNKAMVLVCKECHEKTKKEQETNKKPKKAGGYKNYICAECRYKFKLRKDFPVKRCPYCGKSQIIEDKSAAAQDLIYDSMDKMYDSKF